MDPEQRNMFHLYFGMSGLPAGMNTVQNNNKSSMVSFTSDLAAAVTFDMASVNLCSGDGTVQTTSTSMAS